MQRILPYSFRGLEYLFEPASVVGYNFASRQMAELCLGREILPQISVSVTNVMQAMVEYDKEYLQNTLEPRLYHATSHCLDLLKQQEIELQYIEPDIEEFISEEYKDKENDYNKMLNIPLFKISTSHTKITIDDDMACIYSEKDFKCNLDVKGIFGVKLIRDLNKGTFYKVPAVKSATRTYYINAQNPLAFISEQLFIVNLIFKTSRRIIGVQKNGEIVHGNHEDEWQFHRWRFEAGHDLSWTITDIDDYLKGNPYF